MTTNDYANIGSQGIFVTGIVFGVLAGLAVIFRFLTRHSIKAKLGSDDWWTLAALILFWTEDILQLYATKIVRSQKPDIVQWAKIVYTSGNFYTPVSLFIKLAILCLYRRIFSTPAFNRASMVVIAVCVIWAIGFGFAEIFSCNPPASLWNKAIHGYCFGYGKFLVAMISSEIVLDTVILSLPIRMILGLQMSRERKASIIMMFLLGGFVIITNIVRISYSYDPKTDADVVARDEVWFNIHVGTAILCACLPTYGPMLLWATTVTSSLRKRYGSSKSGSSGKAMNAEYVKGAGASDRNSRYVRKEAHAGDGIHLVESLRAKTSTAPSMDDEAPSSSANMKYAFDTVEEV